MNTWIKRSDREPTKDETPVMYGRYKGEEWLETSAQYCWPALLNIEYNYWCSIKVPPPPRELTQRERDERFAATIANESLAFDRVGAVLMGIHRERREVAKLMDLWFRRSDWGTDPSVPDELKRLRARLDEQGGGK